MSRFCEGTLSVPLGAGAFSRIRVVSITCATALMTMFSRIR